MVALRGLIKTEKVKQGSYIDNVYNFYHQGLLSDGTSHSIAFIQCFLEFSFSNPLKSTTATLVQNSAFILIGEDLKTTVLAEISLVEDSTRTSDGTANNIYEKIDSSRQLYLQLPDGVNQLVIEGKRSSDEEKSGILLDDIHLWPCDQNSTYHYLLSLARLESTYSLNEGVQNILGSVSGCFMIIRWPIS